MSTTIFVAIDKETGQVSCGASGQAAFQTAGNLRKSMSNTYYYKARSTGRPAKEFYSIYEIDTATVIPTQVFK